MERALPRPLSVPRIMLPLRLALALLTGLAAYVVFSQPSLIAPEPQYTVDWWTLHEAGTRLGGGMYEWGEISSEGDVYAYRYSPLLAWAMAPVDLPTWRALHVAVLAFLPWRLALAALLAWPFWTDIEYGNLVTFAFVSGYLALQGSRAGAGAFLLMTLLVPRPLMLPVAAWLLWRQPEWRLRFAAMIGVVAVLTLLTGQAFEFAGALVRSAGDYNNALNFSPSRMIGAWWLLIGVPLGAWLTWRGRLGFATLAFSPYLLPYHFLMGLLEFGRAERA